MASIPRPIEGRREYFSTDVVGAVDSRAGLALRQAPPMAMSRSQSPERRTGSVTLPVMLIAVELLFCNEPRGRTVSSLVGNAALFVLIHW